MCVCHYVSSTRGLYPWSVRACVHIRIVFRLKCVFIKKRSWLLLFLSVLLSAYFNVLLKSCVYNDIMFIMISCFAN